MSAQETPKKQNPALPCGWTLSGGVLKDPDGYPRWIRDDDGRIDRLKVATILRNNDFANHAEIWEQGNLEPDWRTLSVTAIAAENRSVSEYIASLESRLDAHQRKIEAVRVEWTAS